MKWTDSRETESRRAAQDERDNLMRKLSALTQGRHDLRDVADLCLELKEHTQAYECVITTGGPRVALFFSKSLSLGLPDWISFYYAEGSHVHNLELTEKQLTAALWFWTAVVGPQGGANANS